MKENATTEAREEALERVWRRFLEASASAEQEYQETKTEATTLRDAALAQIDSYYPKEEL